MKRFHLSTRELLLIFLFWTAVASLSLVNRLFDPRGEGLRVIPSGGGPLIFPYIEAWLWAALTPVILWLSSKSLNERYHWVWRAALLVVAGLLIAYAADVLLDVIRVELFPGPRRRLQRFSPFRGIGRFLIYGAVLAAGFAREYFQRDQERQRESISLQTRAAQLEAQLALARLDALRMQINPHFLFNTLHAISALVERDPSGVRRMIARLSDLLRQTLGSRGADEVPLRDEMAFLQKYLDIMEVRFQGRLRVTQTIAPVTLDALVPNFILQPIVENALEHGVSRSGDARIELGARRDGDELILHVRDEGPGLGETNASGVGLTNTRARLSELYGDAASVVIASGDGGGVTAELRLPFHVTKDSHV
ncbi:MAG TPA: histidine kinase [Thermoanaerobaculia bacterium]|jgi:two-component sensor histidine kinase